MEQRAPSEKVVSEKSKLRLGALGFVLFVGVFLRAIPIPWGTVFVDPALFGFHPDEPKLVRFADGFPGSIEENEDYRYPLFAHDVLGVLWQGALRVWPLEADDAQVPGAPRFERATIFCRSVYVLLFGLGAMWLLARFTRRVGRPEAVPWVLAAFTMQSFTVANTALAQTDLPMGVMLFALIGAALHIEHRGGWRPVRDPLVLGVLLGAAVAAKYTALIGLLPVAALVGMALFRRWAHGGVLLLGGVLFAVTVVLTFCAFVPGAIFDFENFKSSIAYELESKTELSEVDFAQFIERLTLAFPVWLMALSAFGYLAYRGVRTSVVIGASIVAFAAYLYLVHQAFSPDWTLPLMPLVAVLSGLGLCAMTVRFGRAGIALACVIVLFGWTHAALTVHARYNDDTRYRFAHFIEANIEAPGPIGEAPAPTRRSWASARAPKGYTTTDVQERPEWIVMSEREFEPVQRVHKDPRAFEPFGVVFDPGEKKLAALEPKDIDFFRDLLSTTDEIQWTRPEGLLPGFDYELVETLRPGPWALDMAGLEIRVYRARE